jgi:hypothetical protein
MPSIPGLLVLNSVLVLSMPDSVLGLFRVVVVEIGARVVVLLNPVPGLLVLSSVLGLSVLTILVPGLLVLNFLPGSSVLSSVRQLLV